MEPLSQEKLDELFVTLHEARDSLCQCIEKLEYYVKETGDTTAEIDLVDQLKGFLRNSGIRSHYLKIDDLIDPFRPSHRLDQSC